MNSFPAQLTGICQGIKAKKLLLENMGAANSPSIELEHVFSFNLRSALYSCAALFSDFVTYLLEMVILSSVEVQIRFSLFFHHLVS